METDELQIKISNGLLTAIAQNPAYIARASFLTRQDFIR